MQTTTAPAAPSPALINYRYLLISLVAIGVMIVAVVGSSLWFLNWVHVMSGVLWTGIDLFMGFVIGPVMRHLSPAARQQVTERLSPRMLFLMPALSINTGTAGWFMAERMGFLAPASPLFPWIIAALVIITLLTLQGVGLLMPINLMVCRELGKPQPDGPRVGSLMRVFVKLMAAQGALQVAIIIVMARIVTGGA